MNPDRKRSQTVAALPFSLLGFIDLSYYTGRVNRLPMFVFSAAAHAELLLLQSLRSVHPNRVANDLRVDPSNSRIISRSP